MEVLEQQLRPLLTPITHNLPAPLVSFGTSLIGDKCYASLVQDITITDSDCLKLAISKGLGIGIIGASSIVKIPQLLKLLNSQSAEGISFLSYLLETSSYLVSLVYNYRNEFPISTYGEMGLIALQNVAISVLVLQYSGKAPMAAVFLAGLAAAAYMLLNETVTSMPTLQILQAGAGVLGVASKLPQIITIAREGGTGQLSAFAVGLQLPRWFALAHLHHPTRSRRQSHSLRLRVRLFAQCCAGCANALLLELSGEQEHTAIEAHREGSKSHTRDCRNRKGQPDQGKGVYATKRIKRSAMGTEKDRMHSYDL
nr:mannose-p-dolichol utilization defect 1 protein [Quercus suber]